MKRKLKTWEQFEKEFKSFADEWKVSYDYYSIKYNDMKWFINPDMKRTFGTEIEVEKCIDGDYTHVGINGFLYYWHEKWFEPEFEEIEFLTEEEVEI